MSTTFVVEILGPIFVKIGVKKAGEIDLNITEEDLIKTYKVGDLIDKKAPTISADAPISEIIRIFSNTNSFYYPVVDNNKYLKGCITVDRIRNALATGDTNDWLIVVDIMEPVVSTTTPLVPLSQAMETIRKLNIDYVPVIKANGDSIFLGILNSKAVDRSLSAEVLERQRKADMAVKTQHD